MVAMSAESPTFTKRDRDLIRMEFMDRFGSAVSIHEGFWLRRWATGPRKGEPKIPPVVQSMLFWWPKRLRLSGNSTSPFSSIERLHAQ